MTMAGGALALLLAGSPDKDTSRAPTDDGQGMVERPRRAGACPPNSNSRTVPTAAIRHALRALASESGPGEGLNQVRLLRPLVAQARDILRERFESGGSAEAYLRGHARLADSIVIGLLHIASISCGIRFGSMVAPLAAIAAGGYGRRELAPGSDLDLLFLLPETSSSRAETVAPATQACIGAVVPASGTLASCWIMRRGRSGSASSLPRTIPPCLPAWLTGGTFGAVRACLLLWMPSLLRFSPDPTREIG